MNPHHCSACGTYWTHPRDRAARAHLERRTVELLEEIASPSVEFDDERLRYVTVQMDRSTLEDARALLAEWKAVRT